MDLYKVKKKIYDYNYLLRTTFGAEETKKALLIVHNELLKSGNENKFILKVLEKCDLAVDNVVLVREYNMIIKMLMQIKALEETTGLLPDVEKATHEYIQATLSYISHILKVPIPLDNKNREDSLFRLYKYDLEELVKDVDYLTVFNMPEESTDLLRRMAE